MLSRTDAQSSKPETGSGCMMTGAPLLEEETTPWDRQEVGRNGNISFSGRTCSVMGGTIYGASLVVRKKRWWFRYWAYIFIVGCAERATCDINQCSGINSSIHPFFLAQRKEVNRQHCCRGRWVAIRRTNNQNCRPVPLKTILIFVR